MNIIKEYQYGLLKIKDYKLFGVISLLKLAENDKYKYIYLLGIPFLKIKSSKSSTVYKLFFVLTIYEALTKTHVPYFKLDKHYNSVLRVLKQKLNRNEKIRVAFYIIEVFQYASIYETMLKSDIFEPFIVVVPDVYRKEIMLSTMDTSYNLLKTKYDNVYLGYDKKSKKYIDFSSKADIVFFGNPYVAMAHKYHFIWHALKHNILTCYQNYGYNTVLWGRNVICNLPFYNACWKVFADSKESYDDLVKYQPRHAENAWISGYCKMDKLAECKQVPSTRKRILLCPHHTIDFARLNLSNFLKYSDFFLELPQKYPEIDFIFRPHQLLRYNLAKYWGEEKAEAYYSKMMSYSNVCYDVGQDYFQTFMNSDAMIHDCGSFTAEYLFANKPCCYMLKNKEEITNTFLPIGQKCLKNYYLAFNKEEICYFIENVVLAGNDTLAEQRAEFSNYLKLNYPNVGQNITEYIKQEILNA